MIYELYYQKFFEYPLFFLNKFEFWNIWPKGFRYGIVDLKIIIWLYKYSVFHYYDYVNKFYSQVSRVLYDGDY